MTSCCLFVSLSSLCFATDEDGRAVENFCNTLFKCIYLKIRLNTVCFNIRGIFLRPVPDLPIGLIG
jgi:hypothetical protein